MPVNQDQFAVTPYQSSVPLVQIPPGAIEAGSRPAAPLQGNVTGKGTGALAIGDSLLKGFMMGHQQKEQKKYAQAEATIKAADAASESAYQEYQNALTTAGGKHEDPKAQAAYQAYLTTFNASKQAKAQFVLPEKGQKGKKGSSDGAASSGGGKDKKQASAGFNNIKDFFEANPHIVPQIALMTMQPKPPGLAPQGQEQVQNLESTRITNEDRGRKLQNEKTYQEGFSTYSHLSQDEISALPPDAKKGYETWQNARAAIAPTKYSGTTKEYVLSNGKKVWLHPEEANEFYPDATPVDTGGVKPGSDAEAEDKFLKEKYGVTRDKATTEQLTAATQYARSSKIPQTSSTSTSTTTPQGDRTTTTTRKAAPGGIGKPPEVKAAPTGQGAQGIGKPPQAGKTAKAGEKAGITPPPGGKQTATTAAVTRQAVKAQQEGYRKAETAYTKAIAAADKEFAKAQEDSVKNNDPSILATAQGVKDRAYQRATLDREDAKASVAKEYDTAVKSIGGTPGETNKFTADNPPPKATVVYKDPKTGKVAGWAVDGQYVPAGQ